MDEVADQFYKWLLPYGEDGIASKTEAFDAFNAGWNARSEVYSLGFTPAVDGDVVGHGPHAKLNLSQVFQQIGKLLPQTPIYQLPGFRAYEQCMADIEALEKDASMSFDGDENGIVLEMCIAYAKTGKAPDTAAMRAAYKALAAHKPASGCGEESYNYWKQVFKGADCFEKWAMCDAFWETMPYNNRLYFGDGASDYVTRGHVQCVVKHLEQAKPTPPASVGPKDV